MRLVDIKKDWKKNKSVYFLAIPIVIYFLIWHYAPIVGLLLGFEEYSPRGGIIGSEWIGVKNFVDFFKSYYFGRLIKNTLILSIFSIIINFPSPIILALLLNELENQIFKKVIQTISYLPYFISTVVICGIVIDFLGYDGAFTSILLNMGLIKERQDLLALKSAFRPIFVLSGTWQGVGYGSIIYLAALSGVDQELYEAAKIDGAGRWRQTIHITLPSIAPTIITLFILNTGSILSIGFEKIYLMQSNVNLSVSEVISTHVYKMGVLNFNYSYSTAVGLFNSVVNMVMLVVVNSISNRISDVSVI